VVVAPFPDQPSSFVASPDGTRIAVFTAGTGPDLLLVHGTTADHRTWRVIAPELAGRYRLHAIDRRGRGDSTDGPIGRYVIERELEDVGAVAQAISAEAGGPIAVVGHSLGGRIALAASLRTASIGRIVAYESAPTAPVRAADSRDELLDALRADLAAGDHDTLLARFMTEAVGMPPVDLAAFRADPVWPLRVGAAPTIVRELEAAESAPATSLATLSAVAVPVLQLVGSASAPSFREGAEALDARLRDGRLVVIQGARHGAHHSHPGAFIAAVDAFLAG
jgi:pimeloyl-ACP methyl ester carboxylesterase